MVFKIGVIADTHGHLRPEAIEFLKRCDLIVHAGDVGKPEVLKTLESIAPTYAIRGNVDRGAWADKLPDKDVLEVEGRFFYIIHDIETLDLDPAAAEFDAVIFGHSHQPTSYKKDGVLYFNPGSAGQRRFKLPVSIGKITILGSRLESEIITLDSTINRYD
ncbi:Putative phosphoesterase [Olavius algarvensis Delta 1 endosymbiont]|nr:Putative phosphoesterase [Olavius algarvensis Delta 1 endosymbiont]